MEVVKKGYNGNMPELPEVETVRTGLERLIVGRTVAAATSDADKSFPNAPSEVRQFLIGATVTAVRRRAKVLLIELSSEYTLVIHLKMTGQLVYVGILRSSSSRKRGSSENTKGWITDRVGNDEKDGDVRFGAGHPNDSLIGRLPDKSTRVIITFNDGSHLYFNDQRKFGWMRLLPTVSVPEIDFMKKVGPEPLEDDFTGTVLYMRLQRRKNTTIKAAILDQTVLAGVGNIYADEALWGAKIHPATLVKNCSKAKIMLLTSEIKYVMNLSIEKGGSTDRNYVNAEGKRGSYIDFARVFRREGQSCPRCGTTIVKTRVAGRGTHLCPRCQIIK